MIIDGVVILGLLTTLLYGLKLRQVAQQAPRLSQPSNLDLRSPLSSTVAVVVPAYNEANNVESCLKSILNSTSLPPEQLEVWLVDDQSTDETWAIAQALYQQLGDPRLKLLSGAPRPHTEVWVGKNWACAQVATLLTADYVLFLDADMRLKPGAIEAAVTAAVQENADLLSCAPAIVCGCWAEWLIQPLMIGVLLAGFPFAAVNDPQDETAFATGQFMLFRRSAYEAIGGHRSVAAEVVEDVTLAQQIKSNGFALRYRLGADLASVQMYDSWASIWEGWTKNLYLGCQRSLKTIAHLCLAILMTCTLPWVALGVLLRQAATGSIAIADGVAIALSIVTITLHYALRRTEEQIAHIPPRYWWLTPVGGVLIVAIAIGSAIKTETGWGWTWRGRSLRSSPLE
ncbi:glycosyltransferase [Oscillatoria sp. FACHB-1407]|uniref:glycosyltransferase n=1 Tax=Oscillatoria sp. FACHB-1407 TaxID=2692847 RepID=UPI001689B7CD|nr:glycosyltransferase family 2 protein [Oscillatoria sp. FACHB-1407]MBD2463350.1 glycosyltransferase [Oscillatoria sp. FACHB-1407]